MSSKKPFHISDLENWPDPDDYQDRMLEYPIPPDGKPLGNCTKADLEQAAELHRQSARTNYAQALLTEFSKE